MHGDKCIKLNILPAMQRSLPHCSSALHAETEACRMSLLLAVHHGWDHFILETDCTVLIAALVSPEDDLSDVGRITEDCKDYLKNLSIVISHNYREANCVISHNYRLCFNQIAVFIQKEYPPRVQAVSTIIYLIKIILKVILSIYIFFCKWQFLVSWPMGWSATWVFFAPTWLTSHHVELLTVACIHLTTHALVEEEENIIFKAG